MDQVQAGKRVVVQQGRYRLDVAELDFGALEVTCIFAREHFHEQLVEAKRLVAFFRARNVFGAEFNSACDQATWFAEKLRLAERALAVTERAKPIRQVLE